MTSPSTPLQPLGAGPKGLWGLIKRLFNLKADTDREGTIELIKSNTEFQSANAWTLVFAIFIASVGLNVNSAAVIIGAMLISPLMGPIIGVGFSLGTYDFELLKKSGRNLAAAVVISIVASTIYFLLSPLSEVQSELLARTRPSFFDVLIAFFGGAAGIVAISRKEKGNAIPGVAIATALMPPLCTAGFGLATRNLGYFVGALYLFTINSVFISISTFLFVRYLGFHRAIKVNSKQKHYINRWITSVAIVVLLPSFVMAWFLQRESFFRSQANKFLNLEFRSGRTFIVDREISYSYSDPKVKVTLLGDPLDQLQIDQLKEKAQLYSIPPAAIEITQSTLAENLEKKIGEKLSAAESATSQLQIKLRGYEIEINDFKNLMTLSEQVSDELMVIFPKTKRVLLNRRAKNSDLSSKTFEVLVSWRVNPQKQEIFKSSRYIQKRLQVGADQITHVRSL